PNILFRLADDLGWGDVSLHDGGVPSTPNIDCLASEGLELRRYYAYPLCSPTRAALLTGQIPRRLGIVRALGPRDPGLPANLPTLPRTLQSAGYQTHLVGKWHLGSASPPLMSGFDHHYGFMAAEIDYFAHTNRMGRIDWQRDGTTLDEAGYSTHLLADEAVRILAERDPARPFYLQVAFNAPHFPLAAPEWNLAKYSSLRDRAALFAGAVDALDEAIGQILETVDQLGLRESTLVVFASDNGPDRNGSCHPFRGGKSTMYEGGLRVPCVLRWPGRLSGGTSSEDPVTAHDWFPTLAAAAGVELPGGFPLDGVNVWPRLMRNSRNERGPFLMVSIDSALYDGRWKLIEWANGSRSLFDIVSDPGESRDRLATEVEIADRLTRQLQEMQKGMPAGGTVPPAGRPRRMR
ncbi:MAG: arylsulfatase, partial [Planctomycetota bacterium]|nr:arylsulfatase [Planctomycetota bacterium]